MKVVVTGASGYIGRHVVDALIKMHHEVIAVDMINKGINTDAKFLSLDIFSDDIYNKLGRPDACIHMAWKDGLIMLQMHIWVCCHSIMLLLKT